MYTVPGFPVLSVELRNIKYQFILPDESISVVDGFVHDDPSLKRTYPTELYVETSLKNACCVDISEMEKSIDISGLNFVGDQGICRVEMGMVNASSV